MSSKQKPLRLLIRITNKYVYAQIISNRNGNVVASASTIEKAFRKEKRNVCKEVRHGL